MYRPNVSMIVFRKSDGKFLLVHKARKNHAWQFPQGGIESGESLEQAAKRELREELGTDSFQNFWKSKHIYFYDFPKGHEPTGGFRGQKQSYVVVEWIGEEKDLHLSHEELDEYRFVYQNELPQYLESKDYQKKVDQVIFEFRDKL